MEHLKFIMKWEVGISRYDLAYPETEKLLLAHDLKVTASIPQLNKYPEIIQNTF